ncbi:basic salivary proline-rich protein 1-like [Nannospalax galili]|uniref:basic salivary proline-rich protein 1-like n=1 Tax=Nannospalax galili TaxID=1026970 RepID=UPI0004ED62CF|nr:basic salivary proline-rich protein 1-like [Nannospalax galili]
MRLRQKLLAPHSFLVAPERPAEGDLGLTARSASFLPLPPNFPAPGPPRERVTRERRPTGFPWGSPVSKTVRRGTQQKPSSSVGSLAVWGEPGTARTPKWTPGLLVSPVARLLALGARLPGRPSPQEPCPWVRQRRSRLATRVPELNFQPIKKGMGRDALKRHGNSPLGGPLGAFPAGAPGSRRGEESGPRRLGPGEKSEPEPPPRGRARGPHWKSPRLRTIRQQECPPKSPRVNQPCPPRWQKIPRLLQAEAVGARRARLRTGRLSGPPAVRAREDTASAPTPHAPLPSDWRRHRQATGELPPLPPLPPRGRGQCVISRPAPSGPASPWYFRDFPKLH